MLEGLRIGMARGLEASARRAGPSLAALIGRAEAWFDAAAPGTLFQDAAGLYPAVVHGDPVALALDISRGGPTGPLYRGLDGPFDYHVDAASGDDASDGSASAPWASLEANLTPAILSPGTVTRVRVASGTYEDQAIAILQGVPGGSVLEVAFEPGCTVRWTLGTDKSATNADTGSHLRIWGNGLRIEGFDAGTGNALGCSNGTLEAWDVRVSGCRDGVSAHGAGVIRVHDCLFEGCTKYGYAHVGTSRAEHYRCTFVSPAGSQGPGRIEGGATALFEDCVFEGQAGQIAGLSNTALERCRLGMPAVSLGLETNAGTAAMRDTYVHLATDANRRLTMERCFGRLSLRQRGGGTVLIEDCVFTAPAAGKGAVVYSNYDPGAGTAITVLDSAFGPGCVPVAVNAANAAHMAAAGARIEGCVSHVALDADLATAGVSTAGSAVGESGVTAVPEADTAMSAHVSAPGAGFAEAVEMAEAHMVGPAGVPGRHATATETASLDLSGARARIDGAMSVDLPAAGDGAVLHLDGAATADPEPIGGAHVVPAGSVWIALAPEPGAEALLAVRTALEAL